MSIKADVPVVKSSVRHVPLRRGRPKKTEGSAETRTVLLDAAEKLFAERGFYGVTTRQVAAAAFLDDAMIYYHFKSKRHLFDEVFERRARILHHVRHGSLGAYITGCSGKVTIEGAIAAFINPMIDLSETGGQGWKAYFTLVAQMDNSPWGRETIHHFFDPIVKELIVALRMACPEVPESELFWGFSFMIGALMLALAETGRVDRLSEGLCQSKDLSAVRGRLIDFCVGGFTSMIKGMPVTSP